MKYATAANNSAGARMSGLNVTASTPNQTLIAAKAIVSPITSCVRYT